MAKTNPTSFWLDSALRYEVKSQADSEDRTMSAMIRVLLREALRARDKKHIQASDESRPRTALDSILDKAIEQKEGEEHEN